MTMMVSRKLAGVRQANYVPEWKKEAANSLRSLLWAHHYFAEEILQIGFTIFFKIIWTASASKQVVPYVLIPLSQNLSPQPHFVVGLLERGAFGILLYFCGCHRVR